MMYNAKARLVPWRPEAAAAPTAAAQRLWQVRAHPIVLRVSVPDGYHHGTVHLTEKGLAQHVRRERLVLGQGNHVLQQYGELVFMEHTI